MTKLPLIWNIIRSRPVMYRLELTGDVEPDPDPRQPPHAVLEMTAAPCLISQCTFKRLRLRWPLTAWTGANAPPKDT